MRQKARLYGHVKGRTIEELVGAGSALRKAGFTAVGHLNPLLDEDIEQPYFQAHARKMRDAIRQRRAGCARRSGKDMDLCIEIHRRLTVPEAVTLARGIEPYIRCSSRTRCRRQQSDAMAWVADHIQIPIATGERYHRPVPVPDPAGPPRRAVPAALQSACAAASPAAKQDRRAGRGA